MTQYRDMPLHTLRVAAQGPNNEGLLRAIALEAIRQAEALQAQLAQKGE